MGVILRLWIHKLKNRYRIGVIYGHGEYYPFCVYTGRHLEIMHRIREVKSGVLQASRDSSGAASEQGNSLMCPLRYIVQSGPFILTIDKEWLILPTSEAVDCDGSKVGTFDTTCQPQIDPNQCAPGHLTPLFRLDRCSASICCFRLKRSQNGKAAITPAVRIPLNHWPTDVDIATFGASGRP